MARPQTASDQDILKAAQRVILRRGFDAFTMAEVAAEVGLSRAAIILRFKSTEALKLRLTSQMVDKFAHALSALPVTPGGDGLLEISAFIGGMLKDHDNLTAFMRRYHANLTDRELLALERRRGQVLLDAIAARMPKTAIPKEAAVAAFMAHIGGTIMAWESMADVDAKTYFAKRTREWLTLAHIPYSKRAAAPPQQARAEVAAPAKKARVKRSLDQSSRS